MKKKQEQPENLYIIYDCEMMEYITPKRISFWSNGDFDLALDWNDDLIRQEDYKGGHRFIVTQYGGENGLAGADVKNYIGRKNWKKFCKWITGQTCPVMQNGKTGYYLHDVLRFKERVLKGLKTYFD